MRHNVYRSLPLLSALVVLGGCGGIEHRVAAPAHSQALPVLETPAHRQALPVFEPPAWNSIENIFLQTEIVRVDEVQRNDIPAAVAPFQLAGAGW